MEITERSVAKILVIYPGALGDFICFVPALGCLAKIRDVHLLARTEYRGLVPHQVRVDTIERPEVALLFVERSDPDPALKNFLTSYVAIYSWIGGSDANYQRNLRAASHADVRCFPFRPGNRRIHISDYYLGCVGQARAEPDIDLVRLTPEAVRWADDYWRAHGLYGKEVLGIAPGSGAKEKNWPAEGYARIAKWWLAERGRVLLFTGPAEVRSRLAERFDMEVLQVRGVELGNAAALLARCSLYVGNDSGLTHLAGALGVGTVAIFGPTDPGQWAPRGRNVRVVSSDIACSPCDLSSMKTCLHRTCLQGVSPERIIALLEQMSRLRGI